MGLKRGASADKVRTPQPENISGIIRVAATACARSGAAMPDASTCPALELLTLQGRLSPSSASVGAQLLDPESLFKALAQPLCHIRQGRGAIPPAQRLRHHRRAVL